LNIGNGVEIDTLRKLLLIIITVI